MTYQFRSETLKEQAESVIVAAFEGDNECAIIDASSNGEFEYHFVVFNFGQDKSLCLLADFFDTLSEALEAFSSFIKDEYEGG